MPVRRGWDSPPQIREGFEVCGDLSDERNRLGMQRGLPELSGWMRPTAEVTQVGNAQDPETERIQ